MQVEALEIPDVKILAPRKFGDDRGFFSETYNKAAFLAAGISTEFCQDNQSLSAVKGTLRGLHFQIPPYAQAKLVRVLRGAIYDVAVDIRAGSPTFGRWAGAELTGDNHRQLWIPPGFAHGFLALVDDTHFLYKTTDVYARDCERCIRWDDPAIGIAWPLRSRLAPNLAPKDATAPLLADAEVFPGWAPAGPPPAHPVATAY